jgi:hypothetical protein
VILNPVYVYGGTFHFANDAAHISEYVVLPLRPEIWQSVFCTEDDVGEEIRVGVPHVCPREAEGAT